jgi:hypothetical protein
MKEFLLKIENKFKNLAVFEKINPHKYWDSLLYLFLIIIIVLIIFSVYLLYQIKNQQIFQVVSVKKEEINIINEETLKKITESFEIRSNKEKQLKDGLLLFRDPGVN